MKVGSAGVEVMDKLSNAHTDKFGIPSPIVVDQDKGNVGKAWFDQAELMKRFKGTFVVNTNCIVPPKKDADYVDRVFTYKIVGIEDGTQIVDDNFDELIEKVA